MSSPRPASPPGPAQTHLSLLLSQLRSDEVSDRSVSLCCHLLASVCSATLEFCKDALDCHLQVIVGTLMAQVTSRPPPISQQVRVLEPLVVIGNYGKDVCKVSSSVFAAFRGSVVGLNPAEKTSRWRRNPTSTRG